MNKDNIYYVCCLIEYIGRAAKNRRADACSLERCRYSADANLAGAAYVWMQKHTI